MMWLAKLISKHTFALYFWFVTFLVPNCKAHTVANNKCIHGVRISVSIVCLRPSSENDRWYAFISWIAGHTIIFEGLSTNASCVLWFLRVFYPVTDLPSELRWINFQHSPLNKLRGSSSYHSMRHVKRMCRNLCIHSFEKADADCKMEEPVERGGYQYAIASMCVSLSSVRKWYTWNYITYTKSIRITTRFQLDRPGCQVLTHVSIRGFHNATTTTLHFSALELVNKMKLDPKGFLVSNPIQRFFFPGLLK